MFGSRFNFRKYHAIEPNTLNCSVVSPQTRIFTCNKRSNDIVLKVGI